MDFFRSAALDVETNGTNPRVVEFPELPIRSGLRHLSDSDKRRPQRLQSMQQIRLIESLEGAGHYRAAREIDHFQPVQIIVTGESVGHEPLIGHDGKVLVDDMKMAIKVFLIQRILLVNTANRERF